MNDVAVLFALDHVHDLAQVEFRDRPDESVFYRLLGRIDDAAPDGEPLIHDEDEAGTILARCELNTLVAGPHVTGLGESDLVSTCGEIFALECPVLAGADFDLAVVVLVPHRIEDPVGLGDQHLLAGEWAAILVIDDAAHR